MISITVNDICVYCYGKEKILKEEEQRKIATIMKNKEITYETILLLHFYRITIDLNDGNIELKGITTDLPSKHIYKPDKTTINTTTPSLVVPSVPSVPSVSTSIRSAPSQGASLVHTNSMTSSLSTNSNVVLVTSPSPSPAVHTPPSTIEHTNQMDSTTSMNPPLLHESVVLQQSLFLPTMNHTLPTSAVLPSTPAPLERKEAETHDSMLPSSSTPSHS